MKDEIKHKSVAMMAYDSLKELILKNDLEPGQKIKQEDMAIRLGISRIPLRQALTMLENEGIVVTYPRRGYYVREIKSSEFSEVLDIRGVIESIAINLIIDNLNEDIKKKLSGYLDRFKDIYKKKDINKYHELDREFHTYLIEASGSKTLKKVSEITNIQVLRYIRGFELDIDTSFSDHEKFVDYIFNKESQKAGDLIKDHFNRVKESFKGQKKDN